MSAIKITILSFLAAKLIVLLRLTWRTHVVLESPLPADKSIVFCFWHGNQAALFSYRHPRPIAVLSSLSRDGTLQAKILRRLGYVVCRGSSSRGGASGLKAMIRCLQNGGNAAFAVDGPRGPYHCAKPGAIEAAKQSGAMIVPVTSVASRSWVFVKSWDRYTLPKPFAKVTIRHGTPLAADAIDVDCLTELIERPLEHE